MKYTLKNKEIELTQEEVQEIIKQNVEEKKVGLEIKNRLTGLVIFKSTKTTWKEAVEEARTNGADLNGADLNGADLNGVDLSGADLRKADLNGVDLSGADLSGADLSGADLNGVDLSGADLSGTDLSGTEMQNVKLYGRGGSTKIKKDQLNDLLLALGIIME